MSEPESPAHRYVAIILADVPSLSKRVEDELTRVCGPLIEIARCSTSKEALEQVASLRDESVRVPIAFADLSLSEANGADFLIELHGLPGYEKTRKVLLSDYPGQEDVRRAFRRGVLDRNLTKPWLYEVFRDCVREMLRGYLMAHAREDIRFFANILDLRSPPQHSPQTDAREAGVLQHTFITQLDWTDREAEEALISGIDRALGDLEREEHPPDSTIFAEDESVDGIYILESGQVLLSRRAGSREIISHSHSAGRILGLLGLAQRRRAFFTCRAVTHARVIPLKVSQLNQAFETDPSLASLFATVLIRSLATRNRRVAELQLEIENLNIIRTEERDQLAKALLQLELAQARLVESERLATLGQLSAGMAHELNNPITAIQRGVGFLSEDLTSIVRDLPDSTVAERVLHSALTVKPLSTRALRERRAAMSRVVKNDSLAKRLVKIGIQSEAEYDRWFGGVSSDERDRILAVMERHHQIGTVLRNISSCADRVTAIVKSLKSYAKPDQGEVEWSDIHQGLEDTLLIFKHRMREITLERDYGSLPQIECRPGRLNQVWTNLISNALDALNGSGVIRIETENLGEDRVQVRIIDNGPGIPPEHMDRLFELNYTTKHGGADFGLGMGLVICRDIVEHHGGTIRFETEPGRTCARVTLPVRFAEN